MYPEYKNNNKKYHKFYVGRNELESTNKNDILHYDTTDIN